MRITEADYVLAQRRAARLEEIAAHGKPVSFRTALQTALHSDGPYLIEVPVDIDEPVLPMQQPGGSMDELIIDFSQEEQK